MIYGIRIAWHASRVGNYTIQAIMKKGLAASPIVSAYPKGDANVYHEYYAL